MNEEFEVIKSSHHMTSEIKDIKENPITEALISLIKHAPIIGDLIDSSFKKILDDSINQKEQALLTCILEDRTFAITSAQVKDVEFVVNFAKTVEAVRRLATNDKIIYFANLIKNGYFSDRRIENYLFEEYFEILETLSIREINYLVAYKQHLDKKNKKREYERKKAIYNDFPAFCCNFSSETGTEQQTINFVFARLVRTGFVESMYDTDASPGEHITIPKVSLSGYYLCNSFYNFYDMVLKMND